MELQILNKEHYNCYMASIATIAKFYKRNYYMAFYDYFYFDYLPNEDYAIDSHLISKKKFETTSILQKTDGINIKCIESDSMEANFENIKKMLDRDIPVIVFSDIFHLPWCKYHNKIHYDHAFIIHAYSGKYLYVTDSYFSVSNLKIDDESLCLTQNYLTYLMFDEYNKLDSKEIYDILIQGINYYTEDKIIKKSECLIDALTSFSFSEQTAINISDNKDSIEYVPLLRKLRQFENNRKCYLEMIEFICLEYGFCFDEIEYDLRCLIQLWRNFTLILSKHLLKNSIYKSRDKISELMVNLFCEEKEIINKLTRLYSEQQKAVSQL